MPANTNSDPALTVVLFHPFQAITTGTLCGVTEESKVSGWPPAPRPRFQLHSSVVRAVVRAVIARMTFSHYSKSVARFGSTHFSQLIFRKLLLPLQSMLALHPFSSLHVPGRHSTFALQL